MLEQSVHIPPVVTLQEDLPQRLSGPRLDQESLDLSVEEESLESNEEGDIGGRDRTVGM